MLQSYIPPRYIRTEPTILSQEEEKIQFYINNDFDFSDIQKFIFQFYQDLD